ncbi:hypothetical protein [Arcanobacterium hippocoleae]|uniref:hypothetical protein n=1 Tax=Arcanobacterium hippocoleae TaxID=149017 RepID=UPI003340756B
MARTSAIATVISRRVELDQPVTSQVLAGYQYLSDSEPLYIECHLPDGAVVAAGKNQLIQQIQLLLPMLYQTVAM